MFLHQENKEPDKRNVIQSMREEILDQMDNCNVSLIKERMNINIRQYYHQFGNDKKRDIMTRAIRRYKVQLSIN